MTFKRLSSESGNAVIELALSLPVLVGLFLGTLQFGYSFFIYNELEQAVRAGARYASMRSYGSTSATPDSAYLAAVQNVVVLANPAGGDKPIVPGLTTAHVTVAVSMLHGVPSAVTVAINNYRLPQIIGSILLTNK